MDDVEHAGVVMIGCGQEHWAVSCNPNVWWREMAKAPHCTGEPAMGVVLSAREGVVNVRGAICDRVIGWLACLTPGGLGAGCDELEPRSGLRERCEVVCARVGDVEANVEGGGLAPSDTLGEG